MTDRVDRRKIYVDANVIIDAFEGSPERAESLTPVFKLFNERPRTAVTSELTWAEVLGRESPRGWAWQTRFYLDLFALTRTLELHPVSRAVLQETGSYRRGLSQSGRKCNLADAIHVVTAVHAGCRYVLTSDSRLIVPSPLEKIAADDLDVGFIKKLFDA